MTPLRILYSYPHRLGKVGVGVIAWHQIAGLAARGMDVSLFCGEHQRAIPGVERVRETIVRVGRWAVPYRLTGRDRAFARHDRLVAAALHRLRGQIDVVHCWPQGALETLRTARQLGIATVLERPNAHTAFAYNMVQREFARLGLPLRRSHSNAFNRYRLTREEAEYALTDRLACPSEFVARTFLERGYPPQKIAPHQYGYDPAVFYPPATSPASRPRELRAAFVGGCDPRKGLHYALEAWERSGAAQHGTFHICGEFWPEYRVLLADKLRHPSIRLVGFTTDVASIMRQCNILILPSIEEGSALVTYEARACGCVLVVSEATGARCRHLHDGLVHPAGDVHTLTEHLRLLVQEPERLARFRDRSLASLSDLTWSHAAQNLSRIYEEACEDRVAQGTNLK